MKISTDRVALIRDPAFRAAFKAESLFPSAPNGHRFKAGDVCTLHGLEDYPEFNGTLVTISDIREDGPRGKAYYVDGPIAEFCNWVYEYRLK